jgi:hypothetical protein
VAIIVTYARPFTANRDRFGKRASSDTSFLTSALSAERRGLHDRIVEHERNQAFAHSDARPANLRLVDTQDGRLTARNVVRVLLEKHEAEGLLANVTQMQRALKPRLDTLLARLPPDAPRSAV